MDCDAIDSLEEALDRLGAAVLLGWSLQATAAPNPVGSIRLLSAQMPAGFMS